MSFDLKIFEGDVKISNNGDVEKVENSDKLIQDILKIAVTPIGSNKFFPMYGSPISRSLIGSAFSMTFSSTFAADQLKSSLETLQKLQKVQQAAGQKVTAAELLAAIRQVSIERNQTDPRYFRVVIKILSKDFVAFSPEFTIGL